MTTTPPYPPPFSERSKLLASTAGLLVVAAVCAVLLVRHYRAPSFDRELVDAGDVVAADYAVDGPWHTEFVVPDARYTVTATAPVAAVPDDPTVRASRPPSGGRFLGLRIDGAAGSAAVPQYDTHDFDDALSLTVRADTTSFPLDVENDYAGGVDGYLALPGEPRTLTLVIGYGGRTQSIDLRSGALTKGDFAPLYAAAPKAASCGAGTTTLGTGFTATATATCGVTLRRLPYVDGAGWAKAGHEWLVVDTAVVLPYELTRGGTRWLADDSTFPTRIRLGGASPAKVRSDPTFETADLDRQPEVRSTAFFSVPTGSSGSLTISQSAEVFRRDDPSQGAAERPTASWTVTT
jgi:hypothetical protein